VNFPIEVRKGRHLGDGLAPFELTVGADGNQVGNSDPFAGLDEGSASPAERSNAGVMKLDFAALQREIYVGAATVPADHLMFDTKHLERKFRKGTRGIAGAN